MLGGLANTATLLFVRSAITQELDLEAAGYFAAAWGITMTYVGFLLGAMGADYFPRLTEVIHDRDAASRLMNDQAQLGFFMELSFNIVFLALVWWLLPRIGLEITGVAFLLGYVTYFGTVYLIVRHLRGFRWQALSLRLLGLHVVLAASLLGLSFMAPLAGIVASSLLAAMTGIIGVRVVLEKIGPAGRLAEKCFKVYARLGWPIRSEI